MSENQNFDKLAPDIGAENKLGRLTGILINNLTFGLSVTRFGEISPLWQNFTSLWQISGGLHLIWQIVEPTFGEFVTLLGYFLSVQMAKYWKIM